MKTTTKSSHRVETVKGRAARALLGAWLLIVAGSASAWCELQDTVPPRWFCIAPSVSITSPANGTIYTSPASFPVTATVNNQGQPITKVDFYVNGAVFQTVTTAPYSVTYTPPAPGTYTFKAAATETNQGTRTRISTEVTITVQSGVAQIYYIHPDHLNTPRLIANSAGTTVWRWDQGEPFGNDVPNNNPSGAGAFDFPLRFPGQYFDRETGLSYNGFRDYDAGTGRYPESDPIGVVLSRKVPLRDSSLPYRSTADVALTQKFLPANPAYNHLYNYAVNSPLKYFDPLGLLCSNNDNYWKCMGFATLCTWAATPCLIGCRYLPPPWGIYCLGGCTVGMILICVGSVDSMCTEQNCPPPTPVACLGASA